MELSDLKGKNKMVDGNSGLVLDMVEGPTNAVVSNESSVPSNDDKRIPISMQGHSGHSAWKKAGQTTWWINYVNTGFFVVGTGNFFTTAMRVRAHYIVMFTIVLRFFELCWHPIVGYLLDAEIGMSSLEKCGLTRKKCGRRVPYFVVSNLLVLILGFFTWRPTKWAQMSVKMEPNALLYDKITQNEITHYKYEDETKQIYPAEGLVNDISGLNCAMKLTLYGTNGTVYYFNTTRVDQAGNIVPMYGNQICESLVNITSVCWPGPTGSKNLGDHGDRVCAYMADDELSLHFFLLSLLFYLFSSPGARSAAATTIEVYPWKEERMQLRAYSPLLGGVSFTFFAVCHAIITSMNEHTNMPDGAINLRNIISGIYPIWNLISFASVPAMKDAKQVADHHLKVKVTLKKVLEEYKDILTGPSTFYVRYMWLLGFPAAVWGSYYLTTVIYWLFWVVGVPQEDFIWFILLTYFCGLTLSVVLNCIFGLLIYGKASKNGREKSLNPLKAGLVGISFNWVLSLVLYWMWFQPIDRDVLKNGGKGNYMLAFTYIMVLAPGAVPMAYWTAAAWQWAIDYDNQSREKQGNKRREATIGALSTTLSVVSSLIGLTIASTLLIGDSPVCDTRLSAPNISKECVDILFWSFLIPNPFLFFWIAILAYNFGLKGKKLENLYLKQGQYQVAIVGTDSWNTIQAAKQHVDQHVNPMIQSIPVTIPENAFPGVELAIPLSNGKTIEFVIPDGKKPGDVCQVPLVEAVEM